MKTPALLRSPSVGAADAAATNADSRYSLAAGRVALGKPAADESTAAGDASQAQAQAQAADAVSSVPAEAFDLNAALYNLAEQSSPLTLPSADAAPVSSDQAGASPAIAKAPAADHGGLPGLLLSTTATLAGVAALGVAGMAKVNHLQQSVANQRHQLDERIDTLVDQAKDLANAKIEDLTAKTDAKIESTVAQANGKFEGLNAQVNGKLEDLSAQIASKVDGVSSQVNGAINGVTSQVNDKIDGLTAQLNKELDALKSQLSDTAAARDELNARIDTVSHQLDRIVAALDPSHAGIHPPAPPSGVLIV